MSKKLILHIGAGKLSMETAGFKGPECLDVHTQYKTIFGHVKPLTETIEETEEMKLGVSAAPQVNVNG
jgi:hypothetical protein